MQSPIAAYLIGLDLIVPENKDTIKQSTIPVVAYTIRSYDDMAKALNANIHQVLVDDINKAKEYVEQYNN